MKIRNKPITPLRQKMIDLMVVKNLAETTQKSYLNSVECLAKYYHQSPDQLSKEDVQQYLIYLVKDKKLAPNSCRLRLQGIRFLFKYALQQPIQGIDVLYPKRPIRIPDLLTRDEALSIVNYPENLKHQCQLKLCYACGLRVSEVTTLRVRDIDGERQKIKVEQGKGMKDRFIPLPEELLHELRVYWQEYRPHNFLFYTWGDKRRASSISALQRIYTRTKRQAKVKRNGGIHSLRHAFATHQLDAGLPLHLLQRWLGHNDIKTTMRYIHWVPSYQNGNAKFVDLLTRVEL